MPLEVKGFNFFPCSLGKGFSLSVWWGKRIYLQIVNLPVRSIRPIEYNDDPVEGDTSVWNSLVKLCYSKAGLKCAATRGYNKAFRGAWPGAAWGFPPKGKATLSSWKRCPLATLIGQVEKTGGGRLRYREGSLSDYRQAIYIPSRLQEAPSGSLLPLFLLLLLAIMLTLFLLMGLLLALPLLLIPLLLAMLLLL